MKVFAKALFSLLLMGVILAASIFSISQVLFRSQVFAVIEVGVTISEEDERSSMAMGFISNMNSVKSICHFKYLDEDEALAQLKTNELEAVIVLPKHFYQDIDMGKNTPATVYFSYETTVEGQIFSELLRAGVSLLQTSEAGVYAALETAGVFSEQVVKENIGDHIAMLYAKNILNRERIFEEWIVSPFGQLTKMQYYFTSLILILLIMSGLNEGYLYERQSRAVEQKLKVEGLKTWQMDGIKILMIVNHLFLICVGFFILSVCLGKHPQLEMLKMPITMPFKMLPVCIAIAIFTHVIFAISGNNAQSNVVLFTLNVLLVIGAGMIIPAAYMPERIAKISPYLPTFHWYMYSLKALFEAISMKQIGIMALMSVIGLGIGAVASWKST